MKSAFVGIISVMLVVIAITFMGCTSQTTPPSSNVSVPTSSGTPSATSPPSNPSLALPQAGSIVNSSSVFGTNFNWFEYQATTATGGNTIVMDMKVERSIGTYQGQSAIHSKITMTSSTNGLNTVYDTYYDLSMNSLLGGTMTITFNGQKTTTNIPPGQTSLDAVTSFNTATPLTFVDIEPVSVPAGSYPNASKYTRLVNETTFTYWSASGIPVPVKMISNFPSGSITYELMGWG